MGAIECGEIRRLLNKVHSYRNGIFDKIENDSNNASRKALWLDSSFKDVRKLLIIASSSRSGSSLLFDVLKKIPSIYSPSGECMPFYKLSGLNSDLHYSDQESINSLADENQIAELKRNLFSDVAISATIKDFRNDEQTIKNYIDDLALRFSIEWPLINFEYHVFKVIAEQAMKSHFNSNIYFSVTAFYLELLFHLQKKYAINPFYYDIPKELLARKFPDKKESFGPPNDTFVIEEPLFILIEPRRNICKDDLAEKILLLKDPVNSYRFEFLEGLFPNALTKIIFLTRNPASSINGLYDGWLNRGFFSGNLINYFNNQNISPQSLNITGYSDQAEWGKWWWNFDRPSRWENYSNSTLEEVCAFQWKENNDSILQYLSQTNCKVYKLKFEEFIGSVKLRKDKLIEICDFIGFNGNINNIIDLSNLPLVQVTEKPKPARWKERRDIIMPTLQNSGILETCWKLEYDISNIERWI